MAEEPRHVVYLVGKFTAVVDPVSGPVSLNGPCRPLFAVFRQQGALAADYTSHGFRMVVHSNSKISFEFSPIHELTRL